jgi:hypothetical protein
LGIGNWRLAIAGSGKLEAGSWKLIRWIESS